MPGTKDIRKPEIINGLWWWINTWQSCMPKRRQRNRAMEEECALMAEATMKILGSFSFSLYLHLPQTNVIMDI